MTTESAQATDPLPYRACVGLMLVNHAGKVFVGQRLDRHRNSGSAGDFWQMPQGGIDDGEDLEAAGLRELWEETGVMAEKVAILARTEQELCYDLPEALRGKVLKGYRGQRQHWLLLRFDGEDADIRLDAHKPAEFESWKWVDPDTLPELIVPFKKDVYRAVLERFGPILQRLG